MKRSMHRATAWLLAVIMLLSCMPMNALAAVLKVETSGAAQPFGGARALSVVDPDKDNYVTFEFYSNSKLETLLETQIVKLDADLVESVIVPATPETPSGKRFEGWKKEGGAPMTFGEVTTANGFSKGTVKVYADFSDVYYVYFLFKETNAPTAGSVFATGEATRDNNYKVVPPTPAEFVVKDAVLTGWVINGTNKPFYADTVVEADTYVAPVTVPAYWVTFDTDGGSSVPSQYITEGKSVDMTKIANPTKLGYTFAGWYLGEQQITGATYTPTASVVLKAHWTAAPVDYTIVYWGENADDTNYSVLATDAKQKAATGTVLHSSDKKTLPDGTTDSQHFSFNSAKDETVTIAADGSSVLNVYFTRTEYTITFPGVTVGYTCGQEEHKHTSDESYRKNRTTYFCGGCYPAATDYNFWGSPTAGGATQGNEICGKTEHTHTESCGGKDYTIKAKYDSDISYVWNNDPIKSLLKDGYVFQSSITGVYYSFLQKMPGQNVTMTKEDWSENTRKTWHYYLETLDGTAPNGEKTETSDDGTVYYQYHSISSGAAYLTYDEDYFPITGFVQKYKKGEDGWTWIQDGNYYRKTLTNGLILYYDRVSYKLELNNYGTINSNDVRFEADISGYGAEPSRPAGYENAQFIGWFEVEPSAVKYTPGNPDKTNTEPFDFTNKTMPAKNLVLYAYWWNPTIKVDITIEVATGDKIYTSENLKAGTTIAQTEAYTNAQTYISDHNLSLVKWVDGDGVTVDINEPLYTNKSIRPVFSGTTYTLKYDLTEGASGVAPTDGHKYGPDSLARVADSTATKEGGKLVFGYWTDSKGNVYYPGQYIAMNADTTLTANYVPAQDKTQLTYKANWPQGDGGEKTISQLSVNGVVTVLDFADAELAAALTAPTNYRFVGWNTAADGTGTPFAPGAQARVDKNGENENVLYAIWELDVAGYTIHHYLEGTQTKIANDETGSMTIGHKLTATAKTTSDTYGKVTVSSYAPGNSVTITADASANVITVYYKIPLTITAKSAEKVYNGSKQTVADESGKEYTVSGLVNGDTIATDIQVVYGDDNADGKINVGTYAAKLFANGSVLTVDTLTALTIKNENGDKTIAYYNVKLKNGTLDITPITDEVIVTITGNHDEKVYNGSEQSVSGHTYSAKQGETAISENEFEVTLKTAGKDTAKGTNVNTYYMGLTKEDFTVTSKNYTNFTVVVNDGWLKITPITDEVIVTITGNHDSKVYNGSEQSVSGHTYSAKQGETAISENEFEVTLKTAGKDTAKGTNVNTYYMGLTKEDFTVTSKNYTNFTVVVNDGWLKITPITDEVIVTITGNHDSKVYNGSEQSVSGHTYSAKQGETAISENEFEVTLKTAGKDTAKGTNVNTYYMGLTKEDFTVTSKNYTNFTVVVNDGWLKITPITDEVTVTITGNHDSKVYNGSEQSVSGHTYSAKQGETAISENEFEVTLKTAGKDTAKGTNVNTYYMGLTKEDFTVTSKNYANFTVVVNDGWLKITPITDEVIVTITGNHDSKVYNGSEQSVSGHTYSAKQGETAISENEFEVTLKTAGKDTAKGTNVNTYYMGLTKEDFTVTSKNYTNFTVVVNDGWLKITPITDEVIVTITGNHDSKVYNGSEQSVSGHTYSAKQGETAISENEFEVTLKTAGKDTAKGTNVNTYYMGLTKEDFTVTSKNYTNFTVVVNDGWLKITPITDEVTVTITGNHDSKVYNGSEQSVSGHTYSAKQGETAISENEFEVTLKTAGKDTAKGTNVNTYYMGLTKEDFTVTSKNYTNFTVVVNDGWLKITPITDEVTVTITGNHDSKVYNGSEQSVSGHTYSAKQGETAISENEFEVTLKTAGKDTAKGTNVNTYYMGLTKEDFTVTSKNYTNFTVVVNDGWLKITPITDEVTVTITGNHDSKVYNGSEQSVSGHTYSAKQGETAISENEFEVTLKTAGKDTAKGTNVNTYYMGLTKEDFTVTSKNYTNFTVVVNDGWLKITPITDEVIVTITGNHDSKVYNGSEQSVSGHTYSAKQGETAISENEFEVTLKTAGKDTAKGTNVNTYYMGLTKEDFTVTSKNYTNFTVVVNDGWLKITPITDEVIVTITGNHDSKVYNGSEQSVSGHTYSAKQGETAISENEFEVTLKTAGKDTAKGTNVNTYYMGLTKEDFTVTSKNYTNFTVVVNDGWLKITPITDEVTVTITGNHDSKVYNGSEQSVSGHTYSAKQGETAISENEFEVTLKTAGKDTAKGTNVNTYYMGLTKEDFTVTSKNYTNFTVVVNDGWLKITPITDEVTVTITGNHDSKVYNGSEQSVSGHTYSAKQGETAISENEFEVTLKTAGKDTAKGTNVNTYYMGLTKEDFTVTSKNYTNFTVVVNDGWLKITPITDEVIVTITGNHDSKVYNGSEQSVSGHTYSAKQGETAISENEFEVTLKTAGKDTAKGTNVNTYYMGLTKEDFTVTSKNYTNFTVVVNDGWLKITPITDEVIVTITGNHDEKVYNGSEQSVSGHTYSAKQGETAISENEFEVTLKTAGKDTAKGTNVNTYYMGLTKEDFTVTSKNYTNFTVVVNDGWLKITPITDEVTVTITGNHDSKVYNGSEQSVSGHTYSAKQGETAISENEFEVTLKTAGKDTAKGTNVNTYYMGLTKEDFTVTSKNYTNFTVVVNDGWLKITPITAEVTVTITGNHDEKVYNGSEQKVTGYAVTSISNSLYKAEYFTFHGKAGEEAQALAVAKGTNAQAANYMMGMKSEDFENISRNFTNVTFEVTDGWLKINKRHVTITANGNTVGYTGDPHGKNVDDPYTAVGLADGHDVASVEIAFTAVNVGIYEDKLVPANAEIKDAQGNTVTENYAIDYVPGTLTIEGDKIVPEKTTPDDVTSNYKLGDKIPFTITVKNVFDGDVAEVLVQDANAIILAGDGYTVENEHTARIALLKKDAVVYVHAEHEVTSDDILKATVGNRAIVSWEGTERPVDAGTDAIDDLDTTLEVKKTSDKADGAKVKLGEVIKYTITVTNKGNVPYTNVEVVDALTGLREKIDVLGVGESESKSFTTDLDRHRSGYSGGYGSERCHGESGYDSRSEGSGKSQEA